MPSTRRDDCCRLMGKPTSAADALTPGEEELHPAGGAKGALAGACPDDTSTVGLDDSINTWWSRRCRLGAYLPRSRRSRTS
ncbi:hypothetical protein [Actinomadura coerulea]|uniref:hypothetical protein n=1 Tax=Actinomadura coerulea TaxID=46159 RepID=UPI003418B5CC